MKIYIKENDKQSAVLRFLVSNAVFPQMKHSMIVLDYQLQVPV